MMPSIKFREAVPLSRGQVEKAGAMSEVRRDTGRPLRAWEEFFDLAETDENEGIFERVALTLGPSPAGRGMMCADLALRGPLVWGRRFCTVYG